MNTGCTFVVSVVEGADSGASWTLDTSSARMLIGQGTVCAIRLHDAEVAPRHSALLVEGDRLSIIDLGSVNGTSVNGVVVEKAFLHGGEIIRVGRSVLVIERSGARAKTDIADIAPKVAELGPRSDRADESPKAATDIMAVVISQNLQFSAARARVMREFERRYVDRILAAHDGNVTRAARASGVALRYFKLVRARLKNEEMKKQI